MPTIKREPITTNKHYDEAITVRHNFKWLFDLSDNLTPNQLHTLLSRVIYVTYAKPGVTVYRSKRNSRFSITVRTLSQWGS